MSTGLYQHGFSRSLCLATVSAVSTEGDHERSKSIVLYEDKKKKKTVSPQLL